MLKLEIMGRLNVSGKAMIDRSRTRECRPQTMSSVEFSRRPWTPEVMNFPYVDWDGPSRSKTNFFASAICQEDELLLSLVSELGLQRWCVVASKLQGRSGKQCCERCESFVLF